jgi:ABC-type transporter Mla subunit MlaD
MPVERSQKHEARIGMWALIVLAVAFLLVFFAADLKRLFTPMATLHVLMPTAAGLAEGSLVWIAGQTVGEVDDIEVRPPDSDSMERVLVTADIQQKHLEHIRLDSKARITSFRMIGDPVLDITPGTPQQPPVQEDDTLRMRPEGSPLAAMERARKLHASLQGLIGESRTLATRARNHPARSGRLNSQMAAAARELRAFTLAVQEGPVNTLSDPEFKRIVGSLGSTIGELRQTFVQAAERARAARADAEPALRRLAARADTISMQISTLQNAIASSGGGLLVRAQTDTAIVKALHEAQVQMDSLIAETKRNPLRFWF